MAILNRNGGTLRTLDLDAFAARMKEVLQAAGHSVEVRLVEGRRLVKELERAAEDRTTDAIMAGGGDGTVSASAAILKDSQVALAVLPAGTMNLFARSLGIPLNLDAAIAVFAEGHRRKVDVATANGRVFIHQFSLGMHAKLVSLRDSMAFRSRIGKITASARAALGAFLDPPVLSLSLLVEDSPLEARTTGIGVTNNLFGEGHLPYADRPDGGRLGVYITSAQTRGELIRFFFNMALGRWRDNAHVDIHDAKAVTIRVAGRRRRRKRCVIDGELCDLDPVTELLIHPRALTVLAPAPPAEG